MCTWRCCVRVVPYSVSHFFVPLCRNDCTKITDKRTSKKKLGSSSCIALSYLYIQRNAIYDGNLQAFLRPLTSIEPITRRNSRPAHLFLLPVFFFLLGKVSCGTFESWISWVNFLIPHERGILYETLLTRDLTCIHNPILVRKLVFFSGIERKGICFFLKDVI